MNAPLLMSTCDRGAAARAHFAVRQAASQRDTPANRWDRAGWAKGRASIVRLLDVPEELAHYATYPIRAIEEDGRSWIGGALNCPRVYDQDPDDLWPHLAVTDVILWEPRSGEVRLSGEHGSHSALVAPESALGAVEVYGDPAAYFRAWAARRCSQAGLWRQHARGLAAEPPAHCPDMDLPGALIVGAIDQISFRSFGGRHLAPGPGLTRAKLHAAVLRSANLPIIEEARVARG